jgi:hypothetical protein
LLEQAIERDPDYWTRARLGGGLLCATLHGWSQPRFGSGQPQGRGFRSAITAGAGDDPGIFANAAMALAFFGEDIGAMMTLVDRALSLNPELRPRLVRYCLSEALGGPARACHRTRRGFVASQPACPGRLLFHHHWRCAFLEPPL